MIDREDVRAQAQMLLLEAVDKYDGRGSARGFLLWYVRNGLANFYRKGVRERRIWSSFLSVDCVDGDDEDNLEAGEHRSMVAPLCHDRALALEELRPALRRARCAMSYSSANVFDKLVSNAMSSHPATVSQLAKTMGLSRTRVYQHLDKTIRPAVKTALIA